MKKIADVIAIILSIVSLIGSLITMYILVQVGIALGQFSALTGTGIEGVSQIVEIMNLGVSLGWVWSVCVLLTSLYAIYAGIKSLKKK